MQGAYMKSVIVEGSTTAKAIEEALKKAGEPTQFFVKILALAQPGFLGFGSKKAKIALFFKPSRVEKDPFGFDVLRQDSYKSLFDNNDIEKQIKQYELEANKPVVQDSVQRNNQSREKPQQRPVEKRVYTENKHQDPNLRSSRDNDQRPRPQQRPQQRSQSYSSSSSSSNRPNNSVDNRKANEPRERAPYSGAEQNSINNSVERSNRAPQQRAQNNAPVEQQKIRSEQPRRPVRTHDEAPRRESSSQPAQSNPQQNNVQQNNAQQNNAPKKEAPKYGVVSSNSAAFKPEVKNNAPVASQENRTVAPQQQQPVQQKNQYGERKVRQLERRPLPKDNHSQQSSDDDKSRSDDQR